MAVVILNYFKIVLIWKIFNPNYDFLSLCAFIWFKNMKKMLLQMTSGFLQLESSLCIYMYNNNIIYNIIYIHMNLAVKFNLLKNTHYSYTPESCLENDSYKLYFDRTILTDIHIKHNRPDIIILNKQQKQAYLLDIAVPNSHNITQTYNTKINKYLELSVAMRNLWCLEKISILPLVISATGIVPQSLFKNLKILDLDNTLVGEIQKGILLYSCHIVRKFLNIDTEHNTQQSQNAEARRR
jgi:hypothetical protein